MYEKFQQKFLKFFFSYFHARKCLLVSYAYKVTIYLFVIHVFFDAILKGHYHLLIGFQKRSFNFEIDHQASLKVSHHRKKRSCKAL